MIRNSKDLIRLVIVATVVLAFCLVCGSNLADALNHALDLDISKGEASILFCLSLMTAFQFSDQ